MPLTLVYIFYIFPKPLELLQFQRVSRSGTKSKGGKQKALVLLKTVEVARKIIIANQPKKGTIQLKFIARGHKIGV